MILQFLTGFSQQKRLQTSSEFILTDPSLNTEIMNEWRWREQNRRGMLTLSLSLCVCLSLSLSVCVSLSLSVCHVTSCVITLIMPEWFQLLLNVSRKCPGLQDQKKNKLFLKWIYFFYFVLLACWHNFFMVLPVPFSEEGRASEANAPAGTPATHNNLMHWNCQKLSSDRLTLLSYALFDYHVPIYNRSGSTWRQHQWKQAETMVDLATLALQSVNKLFQKGNLKTKCEALICLDLTFTHKALVLIPLSESDFRV